MHILSISRRHEAHKDFKHGAVRKKKKHEPTFHSQAETLKARKVGGDGAGPSGSCSPWHESGSRPVPETQTKTKTSQRRYPLLENNAKVTK